MSKHVYNVHIRKVCVGTGRGNAEELEDQPKFKERCKRVLDEFKRSNCIILSKEVWPTDMVVRVGAGEGFNGMETGTIKKIARDNGPVFLMFETQL